MFGSENDIVGCIFGGKLSVDFFPRKIGLDVVAENLTTFFTASKDSCHLELTLGAFSRNFKSPHKVSDLFCVCEMVSTLYAQILNYANIPGVQHCLESTASKERIH